jgi:aspartyl/glutamyl-tRNA(Asn/Gln) amidotransferase C subunit
MITPEEIQKLAELARIEVTEKEKADLAGDIGSILQYVDQIKAAGGNGGGAGADGNRTKDPIRNAMRPDAGAHESGAHTDALVAEFPKKKGNSLEVKKIL